MPDDDLRLTEPPTVTAQMGVRRPPPEAFASFVDPAVSTKFWIRASRRTSRRFHGRLHDGAQFT